MTDNDPARLIKVPARVQALESVHQFENHLLTSALPHLSHLVTFRPHHHLENLVFSADQKFLAGNCGHAIYLWESDSLRVFQIIEPTAWETPIIITQDNRRVIAADPEHNIRVWDLSSGQCIQVLKGHTSHIGQLALSPDGKTLISSSNFQATRIWDLEVGICRCVTSHQDSDIVFSPGGESYMTASGHAVKQWDLQTDECMAVYQEKAGGNRHHHIVLSPDGRKAVTATVYDSIFRVLNLETGAFGRMMDSRSGRSGGSRAMEISPDGQYLLTCDYYNYLKLWDLQTGFCLERIPGNWDALAFSPDGQTFSAYNFEVSKQYFWEIRSGRSAVGMMPDGSYLNLAVLSDDGHLLVTEGKGYDLTVWDLQTGQPRCSLEGHSKNCRTAAFSPDGSLLLSGGDDHNLRLWDLQNGYCLGVWPKSDTIKVVTISPDGSLAAVAVNNQILIQRLLSGEVLHRLDGHEAAVALLRFSSDGRWLYSADNIREDWKKKRFIRWNVLSGVRKVLTHIFPKDYAEIYHLALCLEKEYFVTAEHGGTIVQRDLNSGTVLKVCEGPGQRINALVIRPDGEWIVAADESNQILARSLLTDEVREFLGHPSYKYWNEVKSLVASPDGRYLLAVGFDSVLTFWDWESGDKLATMFNLNEGYLWVTPPDELSPEGWVHTNRPDLISLMAVDDEGMVKDYIPETDERFAEYMRLHNDQEMVMKRLNDPHRYEELRRLRSANLDALTKPRLVSGGAARYLSAKSNKCDKPS